MATCRCETLPADFTVDPLGHARACPLYAATDDPDRTTDLDGEPATDDPDRTTDLDGESTREAYLDGVTALMEARAYVATRFYPPLPVAYGDLLVEALDAARRGDAGKRLDVKGLNPQPRCAAADGTVSAADLLDILRIDPDLYTDEDED